MKRRTLLIFVLVCFFYPFHTMANEEIFTRTPEDETQVRTLPAARWMSTESAGSYFDNSGNLFGRLFNYIRDNDVSMTVPVEGELNRAEMRFYIGQSDNRSLDSTEAVQVVEVPERTVVSRGATGSYSESNVRQVQQQLQNWLASQSEWEADGSPYAVFWNGPMTLWLFKHFEVHIPVKKRTVQ